MASWKGKHLSIGGRLTLIKASLSNLPMCYMSLFPVPKGIIAKIQAIQRNFLWSGGSERGALPLVRWDVVELPTNRGGLGVGCLLNKNIALLFKWIWRLLNEKQSMWGSIIREKYRYPPPYLFMT